MIRAILTTALVVVASSAASSDVLLGHLRNEFAPTSQGLHVLLARHAEGEHNAHLGSQAGLIGADHALTEKGKGEACRLGQRWYDAAVELAGRQPTCEDLARAFFGRFDAIHVSAQRRTLQTLGFAVEQFAQEMSNSGFCHGVDQAEAAITTVFAEREFRVMLRIRETLTTQSANVGLSTLLGSLTESGQRGLLLNLVRQAAVAGPSEFVKQLMRVEAPGRLHRDGLHKYAEHLELEDITDPAGQVDAILRKPLAEFESSRMEGHLRAEHVSHVEARALGYVRHLQKQQQQKQLQRYCVLVVSHGAFTRAWAATQLALSLSDTETLPQPSGEFDFSTTAGVQDANAMAQHMEVARHLGSDFGVQGAASGGGDPAFVSVVHMRNCDMFVFSNPVGDIVPAAERPAMAKLPAKTPHIEESMPRDTDPTYYGRSWLQSAGKLAMTGLNATPSAASAVASTATSLGTLCGNAWGACFASSGAAPPASTDTPQAPPSTPQ
ncbi:MAG: hypothetical protein MHM6MM_002073 [Cercozoa sp. M6MM]